MLCLLFPGSGLLLLPKLNGSIHHHFQVSVLNVISSVRLSLTMAFSIAPISQTTHYPLHTPFIFLHISQPSVMRLIGWVQLVKIYNILDLCSLLDEDDMFYILNWENTGPGPMTVSTLPLRFSYRKQFYYVSSKSSQT